MKTLRRHKINKLECRFESPSLLFLIHNFWFQEILDKEGDDFEEMPNTKIVVARTAFKDNSSFYEVSFHGLVFNAFKMLHGFFFHH